MKHLMQIYLNDAGQAIARFVDDTDGTITDMPCVEKIAGNTIAADVDSLRQVGKNAD